MAGRRVGVGAKMKFRQSIDPDQPYPMSLPKLGHGVIINNVASEMPGSKEDAKALTAGYQTLGFEVQVHENCTAQQMRGIKRWIIDKENHKDCNTFLLTIICHGNKQGHLLDKFKSKGWDTEDFVGDLSVVETLLGKPKLMIIQSCRGSQWSTGQPVPFGSLAEDEDLTTPHIVADKADLFLAYATVPGYRAYGGDEDGSVYLQAFARFLQDHYMKRSLDRIYLMVKQAMIEAKQASAGNENEIKELKKRLMEKEREMERQKKETERQMREMEEKMSRMKTAQGEQRQNAREEWKTVPVKPSVGHTSDVSQVKRISVTNTVKRGFRGYCIDDLVVLSDGTVVISNSKWASCNLIQFNMKTGREVFSVKSKERIYGLAQIALGGTPTLAVSLRKARKIEFRNIRDLGKVIYAYSTGSLQPDSLCAASASTLLFLDQSKLSSGDIYWLDCSGAEPRPTGKKINIEFKNALDMCYLQDEREPLLIASKGWSVFAYNALTNQLKWCNDTVTDDPLRADNEKRYSVTTDGCNYVVAHDMYRINILSLATGEDLGVLKRRDHGLKIPVKVRWCNATLSLIVAHHVDFDCGISNIQFE